MLRILKLYLPTILLVLAIFMGYGAVVAVGVITTDVEVFERFASMYIMFVGIIPPSMVGMFSLLGNLALSMGQLRRNCFWAGQIALLACSLSGIAGAALLQWALAGQMIDRPMPVLSFWMVLALLGAIEVMEELFMLVRKIESKFARTAMVVPAVILMMAICFYMVFASIPEFKPFFVRMAAVEPLIAAAFLAAWAALAAWLWQKDKKAVVKL